MIVCPEGLSGTLSNGANVGASGSCFNAIAGSVGDSNWGLGAETGSIGTRETRTGVEGREWSFSTTIPGDVGREREASSNSCEITGVCGADGASAFPAGKLSDTF